MRAASEDFRQPPGPQQPAALGVDAGTLAVLLELQRSYGDVVSIVQPNGRLAYFVNDAVEVRRILAKHHARYIKGPGFERVKMLLGNGLIVSDGDIWRRSRRMIQPAFSRSKLHRLLPVVVQCCDRRAAKWAAAARADEALNVTRETSDFARELILRCIFGSDYDTSIVKGGEDPFAFLSDDPTRDLSVVMKVRQLRDLLLQIIHARRGRTSGDDYDFLSMYMQATDKQGEHFSDRELLDELISLIVAGFETSANTLSWVWYLVSGHPDVAERMIEEAERCIPTVSRVSGEAIDSMQYTQQVIEETLRLYPPVWLFTRRADKDDVLESVDVPEGTDIYLSPYILHRTERYWPRPDEFNPDRFESEGTSKTERPYFPFSLGPRRCLGEYFSFLEMKVHLGLLLPHFDMQRIGSEYPVVEFAINLRSARDIELRPTLR